MKKQPGIMIYFELRPALELLSDEEGGRLLRAMLDYGQYGVLPDFTGPAAVAWALIRPRLDSDTRRYEEKCLKSQYAVYTREAKKMAEEPLDYPNWKQMLSDDVQRYPTTTSTTTTNTAPTATAASTTAAEAVEMWKTPDQTFNRRRRERMAMLAGL